MARARVATMALVACLAVTSSSLPLTMDVPLYLYQSRLNDDFALLRSAPSPLIANASSYVLFDTQPVGFGAAAPFANSTALGAFWSPSRLDVQTTTWSLEKLNAHGGDYEPLNSGKPIAHLAGPGRATPRYAVGTPLAPLWLVYSDARTDAITSPLNGADVNAVVGSAPGDPATKPFRARGSVVGYARQGSCADGACTVALSESFPSAGGADCQEACGPGLRCSGSVYHYGKGAMGASAAGAAMAASMAAAGDLLRGMDSSVSPEYGTHLHVSLTYSCCYSDAQLATIDRVLSNVVAWQPQNVTFDRAECRIDNFPPAAQQQQQQQPDHYSICVFLDEPSNRRMEAWVAKVEAAMVAAGVPIHVPRAAQEPFHTTLCVVNGTTSKNHFTC